MIWTLLERPWLTVLFLAQNKSQKLYSSWLLIIFTTYYNQCVRFLKKNLFLNECSFQNKKNYYSQRFRNHMTVTKITSHVWFLRFFIWIQRFYKFYKTITNLCENHKIMIFRYLRPDPDFTYFGHQILFLY